MADTEPTGHAAYVHRGTPAIQRMVEFAPSTGGLALWVRHQDVPVDHCASPGASPIATDGNTLLYGPSFSALPLPLQTGLVAHEVLHVALRHPQRFLDLQALLGDVDLRLFNVCADAIVNSTIGHLAWLKLPASSVRLDVLLKSALGIEQEIEASLLEWDVERLYRAIDDRAEPEPRDGGKRQQRAQAEGGAQRSESGAQGRASREGQREEQQAGARRDGPRASRVRAMAGEGDADLLPSAEARGAPEAEADQSREWSERILRGHAGDGAHSMLRALIADLPKTRTPWEQVLRTLLGRALSPSPAVSWSRPSRSYIANHGRAGPHHRMPWEPGRSASRAVPRLAVIVDVSGSIGAELLERFAREVEAITRRLEAGMILVVGDDHVRRVELVGPGCLALREQDRGARLNRIDGIEFRGGGGTDFTPLLEEADLHRPDIGVVLTDLDGPARFRPRWPVIWAVPESHARAEAPFGRKLVLTLA